MTTMELLNEINRLNERVADLEYTVNTLFDILYKRAEDQVKINDKIISSLDDVATILANHSKRLDDRKENDHDKNR